MDHYPAPPTKVMISKIISMFKFYVIYCIVMKMNPFSLLLGDTPQLLEWVDYLHEHKVYSCLMIYFLTDAIEKSLISTGAFEIMLDEKLISSRLETGEFVHFDRLSRIIDEHLGKAPGSDHF